MSVLGHPVLITNFDGFHDLTSMLTEYCRKKVAVVMGVYNLEDIFDPERYKNYKTGILGGLGILFGQQTKLYIYPSNNDKDRDYMITSENITIDERLMFLYLHLTENNFIEDITGYDKSVAGIWSRTVLKMIQDGDKGWEKMLPSEVVNCVKQRKLFTS